MALPSFSHVWSSRQSESTSSKDEKFFLLGQTSDSHSQAAPVFRRNPNTKWFDQSYSFSPFSCCDKPFDTEEKLQEHKKAHIKCFTPDCEFTAHPDMVEKHFQLQHFNNLYRKVCLTDRPEDVAKWINDRKRNFPTKVRVQTKVQEAGNRQSRGQVIEKKQFGLMRGGRGNRRPRGSFTSNFRGRPGHPRGQFRGAPRGQFRGRGRPFIAGHGGRWMGQMDMSSDAPLEEPMACLDKAETKEDTSDSDQDDRPVEMSSKRPVGGLSLLAGYDSSEEEMEEEKEQSDLPPTDPRPPPDTRPHVDFRRRDPVLRMMRRRENCMEDKRRLLSRPRLLEMLLARDIQQERNILMQCCFYIVKRNFFGRRPASVDPGASSSRTEGETSSPRERRVEDEEEWDGDGIL